MIKRDSARGPTSHPPSLADVFLWGAAAIAATLAAMASIPAAALLLIEVPKQVRIEEAAGDLYGDLEKAAFMGVFLGVVALFFLAASAGSFWLALRRRRYRKSTHATG